MTHESKNPNYDDAIKIALRKYEREQREFEDHWIWRELRTTPREFFAHVDHRVKESGIDRRVWNERVSRAKERIAHAACRARAMRNVPRIVGLKA